MTPATLPDAPADWQRLDPRMLLVHPIREVVRYLPALVALLVAGQAAGGATWQVLGVLVPIAVGVLRYLTTRYRVAHGRVELSRGLLSRKVSSTPLDRVRTVDLTASVAHRVVGLTTLRIGTGVAAGDDDSELDLDGLPVGRARALRAELLRATSVPGAPTDGPAGAPDGEHAPGVEGPPLVSFAPQWLRYAPFTTTGLVVAAATLGAAGQLLDTLGFWDDLGSDDVPGVTVVGLAIAVVVALVLLLVVSVLGYLVTNGGFRLSRDARSWVVRRGLLTTRETSIDQERLAGVALGEPLVLRLAGGRHLAAIVTGVRLTESGSSVLVPPSPAAVSLGAAGRLLGTDAPVAAPLVAHGPAAARRRWTRALVPAAVVVLAAVVAVAAGASWWVLVPALVLLAGAAVVAADRVRGLGHAHVAGHLVARSGSVVRRREMLAVDHVIGFTIRATWFQRRVGLSTLAATTAGGGGSVTVLDLPEGEAVRLADTALPGLVSAFVSHEPDRSLRSTAGEPHQPH